MTTNLAIRGPSTDDALPLCVDLDGTLIHTDLLWESLVRAITASPLVIVLLPFWLLKGKAHLKARLAERVSIDVAVLPYNQPVLEAVAIAKGKGRRTLLISGSDARHVRRVHEHLGLFDAFEASDGQLNLTGRRKALRLSEMFGDGGFEYLANAAVDLAIWQKAAAASVVNASAGVRRKVQRLGLPMVNYGSRRASLSDWSRALRVHQWAKNALLFVPVITAHRIVDPNSMLAAAIGFAAFCLCASATYIFNDLTDLDADRHHRKKHKRPFAKGSIAIPTGIATGLVLVAVGVGLSFLLPWRFQIALLSYVVLTVLYSMWFKRVASLDIVTLASLYTLRIIAGAFAIAVPLSFWLLAFSMFIFLCLALVKRVTELMAQEAAVDAKDPEAGRLKGREYGVQDTPILTAMGATSGYLAVLVLALYINSAEVSVLYRTPKMLWLIAPLMLLWVTRLWVVTTRGYMDDDPVFFAIRDPETWVTGAVTALILAAATLVTV